ncbi:MAG: hypothetical protein B6I24_02630 [Bacteroidetes bacterium 4572_128]|nr:MAG: hypothetical protein B6I24_02630 [Bacteroidetes bacterium 4572_128]
MTVTYQTIINEINQIPVFYLQEAFQILHSFNEKIADKKANRNQILSLAGTWNDMSDKDFQDMINEIKSNRNEIFSKNIEL